LDRERQRREPIISDELAHLRIYLAAAYPHGA
jgi:hypothetical protein